MGSLRRCHDDIRRRILEAPDHLERIVQQVNDARDPTFRVRRLRVRNTPHGRPLYEQARLLQDGRVSPAFTTESEVHVIRRERALPAPAFEDVAEIIREGRATEKARAWIQAQVTDTPRVEIRWPAIGDR